ncbi:hypothetical protein GFER_11615 [Geoalkalibacter ferrihydriticus DSM 17813]|uniref:Transposon Tn7 transposition protein TnsD C-terminal domain-containing protein n=2 Tax=Geoalkalibacter ferrihydriticus TaxID=392333 RepID=A0A0C2ECE1_9BACT|nr:hypothetical protein GFER_11615 [Geoalkalibacter ferrihydriticus DSM 17813]
MAGRCLCQEGINPLPVHADLPEDTEPLLWLARQSAWMVNSPGSPFGGIRATLREKVLEKGFGRGSLIEPRRLAKAIEERFGRQTLEWLGTPAWEGERPAAWLRRLLSGQLDGKKRSPALLFLIIIGTLYESLEAFEKTAEDLSRPETIEEELVLPTWSADLFRLLQTGECGLPGISKQLGISTYRLIEKIRQRGWRVPLSHQTRKKLGDAKISAIKEDFMQGMEKTQIMRHHGCSEWALTLIELDEPGLNASFRGAAKLITQERNRARLRDHLSANPTATRIDILEGLPGVYDYMLKQDKEWFYKQISEKKAAAPTPRKSRVDWALLDQNKAIEIAGVFDEMLASGPKPVQATATAALKRAGLLRQYSNDPTKFPLVAGILQERSESRQNFIRRRLAWAVEQMANSGDPISINKLRRVASLPAETMRDHRQEVINLAEQMNTAIDGGSFFA